MGSTSLVSRVGTTVVSSLDRKMPFYYLDGHLPLLNDLCVHVQPYALYRACHHQSLKKFHVNTISLWGVLLVTKCIHLLESVDGSTLVMPFVVFY